MRGRSRGWRFPFAVMVLVSLVGCAVNSTFVYKPGAPAPGGPQLPVKVAVLPFKDGTEDFTDRGSVFSNGQYNIAKAGISATMTALTPELWAKSFAEELAASGGFRTVRFVYGPSEFVDEDVFVEGTLKKAYIGKTFDDLNEFSLFLRASTRSDKRPFWEKEVAKEWRTRKDLYGGCGMGIQCTLDRYHSEYNQAMREIFAAAGADLFRTLASDPGNRAGANGVPLVGEARKEEFVGIGLEVKAVGDTLTVVRVLEGAPASKARMQAEDRIVSVDGKSTAGMAVADAVGRMRGIQGTSVTLGVLRAGWDTPRDFNLVRDVIREGGSAPQAPESVEDTIDKILKGK
jgi:hypothetical protein